MIRFMLHTPVNVRGRMMSYIKANLGEISAEVGDKINLYTPHDPEYTSDCTEEWLMASIENNIMPEVIVTHATEFAGLTKEERQRLFSDMAGKYAERRPIRKELSNLYDPEGIFYPISVTPLAMIYNTENVKEEDLKHSWSDLFNEKYKVVFPDRDKPLSRAVGGFLKTRFPEQFPAFEEKVTYDGSPADMSRLVASGKYDMAMTLLSFAQVGQTHRVRINHVKEGYVLLPQLLVWGRGTDPKLAALADLLTGDEMQIYMAEQDAWPVKEGVTINSASQDMKQIAEWQGWEAYLHAVRDFDSYIL